MKSTFFIFIFTLNMSPLWAGHSEGNGGDHVRATFIKVGQAVLKYLGQTQEGEEILHAHGLQVDELQASLDINVISVTPEELRDNRNQLVDAIGKKGSILLHKSSWMEHFEKNRDVAYLVFHEMLRANGTNDDNYVISKAINPFPVSQRVITRINPLLPLLSSDSLQDVVNLNGLVIGGSGCPNKDLATVAEFDDEKNILEINLNRYLVEPRADGLSRRNCSLALPFKARPGQRLRISLADLSGKVDLLGKAKVEVSFKAFTAGSGSGVEKSKAVESSNGQTQGRLLLRQHDVLLSGCGENSNLRLNTQLVSKLTGPGKARADLEKIVLYLSTEACVF